MHFPSQEPTDDNVEHHKWHQMQLKDDFKNKLEAFGRLPNSELKFKFEDIKKLQYYRNIQNNLFPKQEEHKSDVRVKTSQLTQAEDSENHKQRRSEIERNMGHKPALRRNETLSKKGEGNRLTRERTVVPTSTAVKRTGRVSETKRQSYGKLA